MYVCTAREVSASPLAGALPPSKALAALGAWINRWFRKRLDHFGWVSRVRVLLFAAAVRCWFLCRPNGVESVGLFVKISLATRLSGSFIAWCRVVLRVADHCDIYVFGPPRIPHVCGRGSFLVVVV